MKPSPMAFALALQTKQVIQKHRNAKRAKHPEPTPDSDQKIREALKDFR
ncbi:hypothetical protein [Deinococcus misasensis]|nr:hypothetical protein [Deinococcus misasensis]